MVPAGHVMVVPMRFAPHTLGQAWRECVWDEMHKNEALMELSGQMMIIIESDRDGGGCENAVDNYDGDGGDVAADDDANDDDNYYTVLTTRVIGTIVPMARKCAVDYDCGDDDDDNTVLAR
jgi:hypothetical protein